MKMKLDFRLHRTKFHFDPFSIKQLKVLTWWRYAGTKDKEAIIADGSVRAGKTVIMSLSYVLWSMHTFSNQQFGIAGKTIGSLRRNVVRPLKSMLESRGYTVHDSRTENLLVITKGSKTNYYFLFGGKDESSQDLVQGITLAGFFFDEVALMPESFVNQATARCSVDGSKLWFNCNPAGPYHWFKVEYLDQLDKHKAIRIHFTMSDNPSLSQAIRERFERMYSGVFYQRYILGLWVMSEGIIYDNFDENTMVVDPPDDAVYEKYYVSCDYGTLNPTVFLLWGLFNGVWYCLDEYYYSGRTTQHQRTDEQYANDLDKFLGSIKATIIVDPSAASFITLLKKRGRTVIKAKNDVLDGIRATQTAMNTGQILFTRKCKNLFKELASYIWDDKASERGEDKPVKQHDHACDAMRYFVYMIIFKKQIVSITKRINLYNN
ncbi:PBSX family phage terminase large subunit [Oenococcus sicerae]|uniref:PBSX family phage terminase large subunit n=2 Tax=Oenococcus sicerae TaxID=2203724 RepID=A0ABX5QND6_9LACO|nr:PBSX family phage terminase large subunit [Oenococcus sicerae]QAS70252.1 PBSX family phage terminase large subunit [Oenococcus sicerae]